MRICLVSNGRSEHIQRLSSFLASSYHEVHLISGAMSRISEYYSKNIKLHQMSAKVPLWPLQIRQLVRKIQPDIVDGHFASVYGFLAAISGFHPLVITVWGSDIFIQPLRNPIWRFTTKYALNKADIINCLFPKQVADPALINLKINISKVRTGLLGVNTEEFKPMQFDYSLAKELGISPNNRHIINTRGFAPVYDFKTFFYSIPLVLEKIPDAKFIVVHKKEERQVGERLAQDLGILNNIHLIEWLPRSKIPRLLSLANIFVSTAVSDGASNALLEAMSCGLTPVVTDIAANRPWVKENENGLVFPAGNSHALAEKIIYLLSNHALCSQYQLRSRKIAQENAEQSKEMKKIENTYRELIST